jgi:ribosomal protein L12E/L44/L45/RPP1/RPP2
VTDRKKMEGYCSTGQSPPWAVVPVEEEEEEEEEEEGEEEEEEERRRSTMVLGIVFYKIVCYG